jgi:DNA polymerase III subunit epsilon
MLDLFYDSETTDLPAWQKPSSDPCQPHLVQIAALLVDHDTRKIESMIDLTIRPEGWTSCIEASERHGITDDYAKRVGIPEEQALLAFLALWRKASVRIGHVQSFDARIVRIATMRYSSEATISAWKDAPALCTANIAKPAMGIKKQPTLSEAYKYFTGEDLHGAHTALADTKACMEVYYGSLDKTQ